ncbi:hypothetical protein [Parasphaerochaeta coccoides]|uniref:Uncharacterized protein n=1 Tax=Parasphaerochaeta coccoides (strain ATCC BAA-1237 / DSM 17374 / SPN1) TaxID=760011 RepID=F4GKU2_PARC1|nr:hypothetical protein [Parasphaerochaeta coccoides]AEC01855.1 hypothetical protein Spico_0627 [Parasphaerochaeta coccoides DSM 17374]
MDKKPASLQTSRMISNECMVEIRIRPNKQSPKAGVCWAPEVAQFMIDAFPYVLSHAAQNDEWINFMFFSDDSSVMDEGDELED